jgi:hypothetical protein
MYKNYIVDTLANLLTERCSTTQAMIVLNLGNEVSEPGKSRTEHRTSQNSDSEQRR